MLSPALSPENSILEGARNKDNSMDGMDRRLNNVNSAMQTSLRGLGSLGITAIYSAKTFVFEPITLVESVLTHAKTVVACRRNVITANKYCILVYGIHLIFYLIFSFFYSIIYTILGAVGMKAGQDFLEKTCNMIISRIYQGVINIAKKDSSGYVGKGFSMATRCYSCETKLLKDEHKNKIREIKSSALELPSRIRKNTGFIKDTMRYLQYAAN